MSVTCCISLVGEPHFERIRQHGAPVMEVIPNREGRRRRVVVVAVHEMRLNLGLDDPDDETAECEYVNVKFRVYEDRNLSGWTHQDASNPLAVHSAYAEGFARCRRSDVYTTAFYSKPHRDDDADRPTSGGHRPATSSSARLGARSGRASRPQRERDLNLEMVQDELGVVPEPENSSTGGMIAEAPRSGRGSPHGTRSVRQDPRGSVTSHSSVFVSIVLGANITLADGAILSDILSPGENDFGTREWKNEASGELVVVVLSLFLLLLGKLAYCYLMCKSR